MNLNFFRQIPKFAVRKLKSGEIKKSAHNEHAFKNFSYICIVKATNTNKLRKAKLFSPVRESGQFFIAGKKIERLFLL